MPSRRQNMTERPIKTAEEFAARWVGKRSVEDLLDAQKNEKRQMKMVGLVIDAALVTNLCHALNDGKKLEKLRDFLHLDRQGRMLQNADKSETLTLDVAQRMIDSMRMIDDESARLPVITHYVLNALVGKGLVVNHRDLVTDQAWANYREKLEQYKSVKSYYDEQGLPNPPLNSRPEDPRIIVCNKWTNATIAIKDNGAKSSGSITGKVSRKRLNEGKKDLAAHIRDVNRVMILPAIPEVADTFYHVLDEQIRRRVVASEGRVSGAQSGRIPHLFVEKWAVKSWGQFDRMAYIALHGEREDGSLNPQDVHVAEIKAVGRSMERADLLTAPIYNLQRELNDIERSVKKGDIRERYESCRAAYEHMARDYFKSSLGSKLQLPEEFQFPSALPDNASPKDYERLRLELVGLNQRLHIEGLNSEEKRGPWIQKFARTAFYQQAARETQHRGLSDKNAIQANKVAVDLFEEGLLTRLKGISLVELGIVRKEAREEWKEDQGLQHRNARPRSSATRGD